MENNCYIKNNVNYKVKLRDNREISVREIQKEILTIMDEVDRICRKYNITYGLIAGSALGIVNYGGFIPWDDDIDMFILRSDYDRFIEALDKELGSDFYYHCYDKDDRYNIFIPQMKIRKKNTYIEEMNIFLDNKCVGDGIFIDVVTYGEINENKFIDEFFRSIIKIIMVPTVYIDNLGINPRLLKKIVKFIDKFYTYISRNSNKLSQPITIPWEKFMHEPIFFKNDILPVKEYNFEGRKYYSYNNIEKILKSWYGDNCLKKYNNDKEIWEETLDVNKRHPKHVKDINLVGNEVFGIREKNRLKFKIKLLCYFLLFLFLFIIFFL